MKCLRNMIMLGTMLAAAAPGCGDNGAPTVEMGTIGVLLTSPSDVKAIHIAVTGDGISGSLDGDMQFVDPSWSLTMLNVPVGDDRTVTANAYSDEDELPAHLLYTGTVTGVHITAGTVTEADIALVATGDGGGNGGIGINTPPHVVSMVHDTTVAADGTTQFTATARDPDANAKLTYVWQDFTTSPTPGLFTPRSFEDVAPGTPVETTYAPPAGFIGTAEIQLTVTDDTGASVQRGFLIDVGSGLKPVVTFDVLPTLKFNSVDQQEIAAGELTTIWYTISYPPAGPSQPPTTHVTVEWTTSEACMGDFEAFTDQLFLNQGNSDMLSATYRSAATPPDANGECDLTLKLTDDAHAWLSSAVVVWVVDGRAVKVRPLD